MWYIYIYILLYIFIFIFTIYISLYDVYCICTYRYNIIYIYITVYTYMYVYYNTRYIIHVVLCYYEVILCNHVQVVQAQSIRLWNVAPKCCSQVRPPVGDLISPLLLCSKNVTMASRLFAGIPHRTWVSLTVGPTAAKIGTCILCLAKEPRSQGCVMQDCFNGLLSDSIFMRAEVVSK